MKHLLIAASILAMSAGYAAADVTWSASASAGIAKNGTSNGGTPDPNTASAPWSADDTFHAYSNFDITVTATGQTDSGLSFGASFDASGGESYALDDGDGFSDNDGTFGTPTIYVSGTFGKITFSAENTDFFNSDATNGGGAGDGDVMYEGTFGGLGVGLVADIESGDLAVQGTYTLAGIELSADYNQDSTAGAQAIWDASASYTMGNFSATLSATNDNNIVGSGGTYDTSESVKLAYSAGGIEAWVQYNTNATPDAASVDVGGSYTSGPMSITVEADDVSQANGTTAWTVTGSYDLGGGLSLEAGTNYTGDVMVGASMSF
jgi:outer membrane protein OmpU